jgi:hypothetical protein
MQGHQQVSARGQSEPRGLGHIANGLLDRHEAVDHRVADEVHARFVDPLGAEVVDCVLAVDEQQLGELICEHPVDFLGHLAIEAAQARLDVSNWNLELGRHQRCCECRVDVP